MADQIKRTETFKRPFNLSEFCDIATCVGWLRDVKSERKRNLVSAVGQIANKYLVPTFAEF